MLNKISYIKSVSFVSLANDVGINHDSKDKK